MVVQDMGNAKTTNAIVRSNTGVWTVPIRNAKTIAITKVNV